MEVRYSTREGLEKIRKELEDRKTNVRQEIAIAIKEAKEQGDLSENAEYSAARARQSENEARIAELELLIKTTRVAEKTKGNSEIGFGSQVEVKMPNGAKKIFSIVGTNEADPLQGKISNESPLGKAFLGKKAGDIADVSAPSGTVSYEILSVK
jgi:transcription elongation factor GreA